MRFVDGQPAEDRLQEPLRSSDSGGPRPLAGVRCLVTGATGALGTAVTYALRRDGADLLLVARSGPRLEELAERLGEDGAAAAIHRFALDLEEPAAAARVAAWAEAAGGVDGLVNNAAIQGPIGPLWENDWADWERTVRVNLLVPVALTRALVPLLQRARRGKVVNLSGGGATGPRANFSAYGVAKTGLVRFTETFAREAAPLGIDVNAVAPGPLPSAMTAAIRAAGPQAAGTSEHEVADRMLSTGEGTATIGRAADLVAYLLSSSSDGITGRLIAALWDPWPTLHERRDELATTDIYTLRRIVPRDRGRDWGD